jgi:hypothetical protein
MTDYTAMMIDFMRKPRGETEEIQTAMLNVVKNGLRGKLVAMERWYHTVFTDTPHGKTPDQEMMAVADAHHPPPARAKTGCLIMLIAVLSASAALSIGIAFVSQFHAGDNDACTEAAVGRGFEINVSPAAR